MGQAFACLFCCFLIWRKAGRIIYNFLTGRVIARSEATKQSLSHVWDCHTARKAARNDGKGTSMQSFELAQLISQRESINKAYLEFLKVPDLSMGLYFLPVGVTDTQSPHTEDEVYYVVSGRAKIKVAKEDRD